MATSRLQASRPNFGNRPAEGLEIQPRRNFGQDCDWTTAQRRTKARCPYRMLRHGCCACFPERIPDVLPHAYSRHAYSKHHPDISWDDRCASFVAGNGQNWSLAPGPATIQLLLQIRHIFASAPLTLPQTKRARHAGLSRVFRSRSTSEGDAIVGRKGIGPVAIGRCIERRVLG